MANWKSYLKADPTEWLLEQNNPSVRYFTLTKILDRKHSDNEVKRAKAEIALSGMVPKILKLQEGEGSAYKECV